MSLEGLYAITDEILTPDETVFEQVQAALGAGVRMVQYRNKSATDDSVETVCRRLQGLCREYDATFILDDRLDLAVRIGADGLHIGKDDPDVEHARARFKGILGVSCYGSLRRAQRAQSLGADYVAFGSFFPSPTKPHAGIVSPGVLDEASAQLEIPVCAIGGINVTNIHLVAEHRPQMIAVVSAVFDGRVERNVRQLIQGMHV